MQNKLASAAIDSVPVSWAQRSDTIHLHKALVEGVIRQREGMADDSFISHDEVIPANSSWEF